MKKLFNYCLLLMLTFVCLGLFSTTAAAQENIYKTNVDPFHTWTITFNDEVDVEPFINSVTLQEENGDILPLRVKILSDKNKLAISPPPNGYKAGARYTLFITTEVRSVKNQRLKKPVQMTFDIKHAPAENGLSPAERELADLINSYRVSLGLSELTISKSLTDVARAHVKDSNTYSPENGVDDRNMKCNLHSWSGHGNWKEVCYTSDHQYAELMWSKPKELTNYKGNGYEISVSSSGQLTPTRALNAWKGSAGHNDVIIGKGYWSNLTTMGVAIDGHYAHVWFGEVPDEAGYY